MTSAVALAVVLGAFALRIWQLSSQSFWWDDSYSTMVASRSLSEIVGTLAREDFHPPLHYFLLHYWLRLAGTTEFAIRYLSVLAGVLTVAAAGATARRLYGSSAVPAATLAFGASPFLWYYSQEARMFALAALFATLALYCCARAVGTGRWLDWAGYSVFVCLGLWDFYYAAFLPLACGVWIVLARPRTRLIQQWLIASAVAGATYLPWVPIFLARTSAWAVDSSGESGPIKVVVWTWQAFLLGLPTVGLYREPLILALLAALAVIAAGLVVRSALVVRQQPGALLAVAAFLIPLAMMAAISSIKPIFHPRYAITALPGLLLVFTGAMAGIGRTSGKNPRWSRWLGAVTALLIAISSIYGLTRLKTDPNYARDDYRSAIGFIHNAELPNDRIIHNAIPPFAYYDHGPAPSTYFPSGPYGEANVVDELNQVTAGHPRLWYLDNMTIPNDPDGYIDNQLRLHARKLDEHWFGPLRLQLWDIPGSHPFIRASFTPVSINFADELLVGGYAVSGDVIGGSLVDVELDVSASRVPKTDVGFWVALADDLGHNWGRADVRPHDAAYRLSSGWAATGHVVVRFDLPVAIGTPPGNYHLVVGAYRLADLTGLDVLDSGRHPVGQAGPLGDLTVTALGPQLSDDSLASQPAVEVAPGLLLLNRLIEAKDVSPGDKVLITLLWRPVVPLGNLDATVAVKAPNGESDGSIGGPVGGSWPVSRWPVGRVVREQRVVAIAATAPAGEASVVLQIPNGTETTLGTIKVREVKREFSPPILRRPVEAHFGDVVSLVGYEGPDGAVNPGGPISIALAWRADRPITTSYHVFLHLLDSHDKIWAQWDGVPRNWTYPMTAWLTGEYVLDHYQLQLDPQTPRGALTLEVGIYDAVSGQRVNVASPAGAPSADRFILQQVQVTPT